VGVGCAENADQPLLETTPELQSSLSALSQTNVPQAFQMPNGGNLQKPGGTMMGIGGMMHQNGNMSMSDAPMEQVEDSRDGEGMEDMPNRNAEKMGQMMGDEHHQAMSDTMTVMHDVHHQQPAVQPPKPAEPPPAQPGQQVPDAHNQHHP